jgi:lysophospholipase L1-like esterase
MKFSAWPKSALSLILVIVFSLMGISDKPSVKKWDIDIVYIGNSITEGSQLGKPKKEAPPAAASKYLRKRTNVGKVAYLNQGKSGVTTTDYLPSGKGELEDVINATRDFHRDTNRLLVFTISLGKNEEERGADASTVDPVNYQRNLRVIADYLLTEFPRCKIVFLQPIWYSPNTDRSSEYMSEGLSRLQCYFSELQSLVKRYSTAQPGRIFLGDIKGFAYFRNNYLTELIPESGNAGSFYLHPNKKGAGVLGKLWGEAIYQSLFGQDPAV